MGEVEAQETTGEEIERTPEEKIKEAVVKIASWRKSQDRRVA
jgi:hypothetical protein